MVAISHFDRFIQYLCLLNVLIFCGLKHLLPMIHLNVFGSTLFDGLSFNRRVCALAKPFQRSSRAGYHLVDEPPCKIPLLKGGVERWKVLSPRKNI